MPDLTRPLTRVRLPRRWPPFALVFAACVMVSCAPPAHAPYVPRDAALRQQPLYFYPSVQGPPRALVFFFGNDVGFWEAHQKLAERLAQAGYHVVGFDVRRLLASLPDDDCARAPAFQVSVAQIIASSRHELRADSLPLVIGGHSLGAELALWTATHVAVPGTAGVLALSPGGRSHLRISASDLAMLGDPTGPGSFSVSEQLAHLPEGERVALVRGRSDHLADVDAAILAAGGTRARRWLIPFTGHSLKNLLLAGPFVEHALSWILNGR